MLRKMESALCREAAFTASWCFWKTQSDRGVQKMWAICGEERSDPRRQRKV